MFRQVSAVPAPARRGRRAAAVVAVGAAGALSFQSWAAAGHQSQGVDGYTGCLNVAGGTLVNVVVGTSPKDPCTGQQLQIHFGGGDITEVATPAGGGLDGGSSNGAATLALAPGYRLPQSCAAGAVPEWDGTGGWGCGTAAGGPGVVMRTINKQFPASGEPGSSGVVGRECAAGEHAVGAGYEQEAVGAWSPSLTRVTESHPAQRVELDSTGSVNSFGPPQDGAESKGWIMEVQNVNIVPVVVTLSVTCVS